MSRIGKVPLEIPQGVKITVDNGSLHMEGPKGKLNLSLPAGIKAEQKENRIFVSRSGNASQDAANHGTTRALLKNMLLGVTKGHRKELEIQGVGFRAQMQGAKLVLNLGFSHQVEYEAPKDVKVSAPKPTSLVVEGPDKGKVGQVAAQIRAFKPPEPYKGKGIRYAGEVVKRKQGKAVTK